MWRRVAAVAAELTRTLWQAAPAGVSLNVNLPDDSNTATPRRITTVAHVGYDRIFKKQSDGVYVHAYGGGLNRRSSLVGTDVEAAADGAISITAVGGANTADFPPRLRTAFEQSASQPR
jgi:broad specificity polyphosphatase/5'/3'-nucleotidase SurE